MGRALPKGLIVDNTHYLGLCRNHLAAFLASAVLAAFGLHIGDAAGAQWGADYFPDVTLTTQDGKPMRLYADLLKGKSVAITVIYTSCTDECPLETARMAEVQRLLGAHAGKDVMFYSISIDPEHDTPEVLKAYAEKFNVGPGWLFLTGKKEDIKLVTRKLGLSRNSDSANRDGHASSLMLGNEPAGQWMRNSAVDNPRFLVSTMRNFFGWKDEVPLASYANAQALDVNRAQFTFQSRCASCHTIGGGDRIGPDLMGVSERRSADWLKRYMREPDKVLAEGDPIATSLYNKYRQVRMPNLRLGDEDVSLLVSFIAQQEKAGRAQAVAGSPAAGSSKEHAHHHH
jgi:protein SCO1/2